MNTRGWFLRLSFLVTTIVAGVSGVANAEGLNEVTPEWTRTTAPMHVFFLGDIVRIESQQFDLHDDAIQYIVRMKTAKLFLHICPLLTERDAAPFRAALLKTYAGQLIEERLPAKAVECARNRSREPARRS